MNTKSCPGCQKKIKETVEVCGCGYDFTMEECPGCEVRIAWNADECPHCGYDVEAGVAKPKPTKIKKSPKQEEVEYKTPIKSRGVIHVPALGRLGQPDIDFPELHFKGTPDDLSLMDWAVKLRQAWSTKVDGCYLSNHGVYEIAEQDKVLRKHSRRIMDLLGGDDWQ